MGVEVRQPVDHDLRLLCGGRVVEPDQRLAVDRLAQDREVLAHRVATSKTSWWSGRCGTGSAGRRSRRRRGQEVVVRLVATGRRRRVASSRGRRSSARPAANRAAAPRGATGSRRRRTGQHAGESGHDARRRHGVGVQHALDRVRRRRSRPSYPANCHAEQPAPSAEYLPAQAMSAQAHRRRSVGSPGRRRCERIRRAGRCGTGGSPPAVVSGTVAARRQGSRLWRGVRPGPDAWPRTAGWPARRVRLH